MALLVVVGAVVAAVGRMGHARAIITASMRAAVQLGAVSLVIVWVVRRLPVSIAFLLVMYGVASLTAGRRITPHRSGWWAALPVGAGVLPTLTLLPATGLVPLDGLVLIPIVGSALGGGLTATVLAGRRGLDELTQRRGEVEAALALGFGERDAAMEICRSAAAQALIPALDQTRTVGLVVLPGAFVGMLMAGAGPVEAGMIQLFVLISLLAAEAVAVLITTELVARGFFVRPAPGR